MEQQTQFKSQPYNFLALWPWAYHIPSEFTIPHLYNGASLTSELPGLKSSYVKCQVVKSLGSGIRQH